MSYYDMENINPNNSEKNKAEKELSNNSKIFKKNLDDIALNEIKTELASNVKKENQLLDLENVIVKILIEKIQNQQIKSKLNNNTSQWDVSSVTDMSKMFNEQKINLEKSKLENIKEEQEELMNKLIHYEEINHIEEKGRVPGSKLRSIMNLQGQSGVGKSISITIDNSQTNIVDSIPFSNNVEKENNIDNKKKIKVSLFKRLGMYLQFWKINEKSSITELTQEERELQEKIDKLIAHSILPEVYRLSKSGVNLSEKQKTYFDIALNNLIIEDKIEQLKEMISEGYYPRKSLLANWIISYQNNPNLKEIFQKELKDTLRNEEVIREIMVQWDKKLSLYLSEVDKLNNENVPQFDHQKLMRAKLNKEMKQTINLFNTISVVLEIDSYIQMLSQLKEINQQDLKLYRSYAHNVFWRDPNNSELKEYHDAIKDSLKDEEKLLEQINYFYKNENEIKNKSFKIELTDYPKDIQEQLIQLELKIEECKKEKSNMPEYEWERLEGLWINVLNKSLKSYLEMSDKHKKELVNIENKTPQHLLSETITHIDEAIEAKLLEINENRLNHLSVTQRYTKTIKKTI